MRTSPSSPWVVRCSVRLYRWLLCLGPHTYRRQYADHTLQLFQECCQDAYREHGILGVLGLWLPLFSDVIVQMGAEHLSELQRVVAFHISVETVSSSVSERTPSMSSTWQRINHQWIIPPFSTLTRFRRKLTQPLERTLKRELNRLRLKHPTNMHFEQQFLHWSFFRSRRSYERGIDASNVQEMPGAFLRSTTAEATAAATLRQTIKANEYRGKQLRFSGNVKVEQVEQQAGLYIHTNKDQRLQSNMVQGTHDWTRYEAIISIPEDALYISFGFALYGKGQVWLANAQLEAIEQGGMLSA